MKPRFQAAFVSLVAITMMHSASAGSGTWSGATIGTWDTAANQLDRGLRHPVGRHQRARQHLHF